MIIKIFCTGGYKGFVVEPTEERPIAVEATLTEWDGGYHVKVSDLEAIGVYSSAKGQAPAEEDGGGIDYNPETGTLFFMHHEVELQKFGKVKVKILSAGGYPWKKGHARTFPVIVNGYRESDMLDVVRVNEADAKAIGMYAEDLDPAFCLVGHPAYNEEAVIL